jgi:hypothetical protein
MRTFRPISTLLAARSEVRRLQQEREIGRLRVKPPIERRRNVAPRDALLGAVRSRGAARVHPHAFGPALGPVSALEPGGAGARDHVGDEAGDGPEDDPGST